MSKHLCIFTNRVQCDNCGIEANIGLYGGYDYDFWRFRLNYANVGFRIADAQFKNIFSISVADGFTFDKHVVLGSLELPGLSFAGLLELKPIVKLNSDIGLSVNGGSMNMYGLGLRYVQRSQEAKVEFDLLNRRATSYGFTGLEPKINVPTVVNTPSDVQFRGALGPEFGMKASILREYFEGGPPKNTG